MDYLTFIAVFVIGGIVGEAVFVAVELTARKVGL